MQLGYSPAQVSRHYMSIVVAINATVYILAALIVICATNWWSSTLSTLGVQGTSTIPTLLIGLAIILLITAVNLLVIARKTRAAFR